MGMWIGRNRKARVTYGFDEIALVPGRVTINPNEVDITWRLARKNAEPLEFKIPMRPIRKKITGLPAFTTLKGGAYFFLPGLKALRYLATLDGR